MLFPYQKKQQKLIIVLVAVVLIAVAVLYFGFRREKTPADIDQIEDNSSAGSQSAQKIDLDADFLKDPQYQALKVYGNLPANREEVGRQNPFVPY